MKYALIVLVVALLVMTACKSNTDDGQAVDSQGTQNTASSDTSTPSLPQPPGEVPSNPADEVAQVTGDTTITTVDENGVDDVMNSIDLDNW